MKSISRSRTPFRSRTALGAVLLFALACLLATSVPASAQTAEEFASRGKFEYEDRNFGDAVQCLKQAVALEPGNAGYQHQLGLAQLADGNPKEAAETLCKAAQINPNLPGVWFDLGRARFQAGDNQGAIEALKEAQRQEPNRAEAYYYHGLALNKSQSYAESPPLFEKAKGMNPSLAQTCDYYIGVAKYRTGAMDEARPAFERAIAADPNSQVAASSKDFLAAIERGGAARKAFTISGTAGIQYDDNAIQAPAQVQFNLPARDQGDFVGIFYINADYRPFETEKAYAGVSYSFYNSQYFSLEKVDLLGNTPGLYAGYRMSPNVELRLQYLFNYYLLNYDNYLAQHELTPSVLWKQNDRFTLQGYTSYKHRMFKDGSWNDTDFPINDLDADSYVVGFLEYIGLWANKANFYFGMRYDYEEARDNEFTYHGLQGTFGITGELMRKLSGYFETSFQGRGYRGVSSFVPGDVKRDDGQWIISTGMTYDINRCLQASFRYLHYDNGSNGGTFEYTRNIYSFSLTGIY